MIIILNLDENAPKGPKDSSKEYFEPLEEPLAQS